MDLTPFYGEKGQKQDAFFQWIKSKPFFQVGEFRVEVEVEGEDEAVQNGGISADF